MKFQSWGSKLVLDKIMHHVDGDEFFLKFFVVRMDHYGMHAKFCDGKFYELSICSNNRQNAFGMG